MCTSCCADGMTVRNAPCNDKHSEMIYTCDINIEFSFTTVKPLPGSDLSAFRYSTFIKFNESGL